MGRIREFLVAIRRRFRRASATELDDELQFHLDQAMRANLATGMSKREARRHALIDFGGVEQAREETWRQRPGWLLETVLQDARYALRGFRRNLLLLSPSLHPGPGHRSTTAVFSVVIRSSSAACPMPTPAVWFPSA